MYPSPWPHNIDAIKEEMRSTHVMVMPLHHCSLAQLLRARSRARNRQRVYDKSPVLLFNEVEVRWILSQLVNGVMVLHKYGVTHRNLKPDNILIQVHEDQQHLSVSDDQSIVLMMTFFLFLL